MFAAAPMCRLRVYAKVSRSFSRTNNINTRVTVVGGAGGIGASLCLLLKLQPDLISELVVYDNAQNTLGVVLDLSHISTAVKVTAFAGVDKIKQSLTGADLVIILASASRILGMTRDDLLGANASVIRDIAKAVAAACPDALINIISNPVNSLMPIFCEVMKRAGKLAPNRVFGVSTLDLVRASTFIGQAKGLNPAKVTCPVVGGHSGISMVPLISQCQPPVSFSKEELLQLCKNIQEAGTYVIKAKLETGAAQLSMAYAGARFAYSLLRARKGESNVVECAFTINDIAHTKYFSTKLLLGKNGIEKYLGIGKVTDLEQDLLNKAKEAIKEDVEIGEKFV